MRCPTGESRITAAFGLPARHVIHTVGPVWRGGDHGEAALLASCYASALRLARAHEARSIAFPAISCGVYGYPPEAAAEVVRATLARELDGDGLLQRVVLVAFDEQLHDVLWRTFA